MKHFDLYAELKTMETIVIEPDISIGHGSQTRVKLIGIASVKCGLWN